MTPALLYAFLTHVQFISTPVNSYINMYHRHYTYMPRIHHIIQYASETCAG